LLLLRLLKKSGQKARSCSWMDSKRNQAAHAGAL
jgi:hypothetical protein